jgi:osomolarity two-component system response regulator SKN7
MISRCTSRTVCWIISRTDEMTLIKAGMNDVLPKPFTKEGLLNMLEKHLAHLKRSAQGTADAQPMGAPPPPAINSAKRSMKSEDSPITSPATGSNWNSPGNLAGVSPAGSAQDDPYMHALHNNAGPGPFPVQPPMYNTSPGGPMAAPPRQQGGPQAPPPIHRRGISEISGGAPEMGADAKRQQQMFPPTPQMGQPTPHMMTMPPHMQQPPRR